MSSMTQFKSLTKKHDEFYFAAIKTRKEGGKYKMTSKAVCHRAKKEG